MAPTWRAPKAAGQGSRGHVPSWAEPQWITMAMAPGRPDLAAVATATAPEVATATATGKDEGGGKGGKGGGDEGAGAGAGDEGEGGLASRRGL